MKTMHVLKRQEWQQITHKKKIMLRYFHDPLGRQICRQLKKMCGM